MVDFPYMIYDWSIYWKLKHETGEHPKNASAGGSPFHFWCLVLAHCCISLSCMCPKSRTISLRLQNLDLPGWHFQSKSIEPKYQNRYLYIHIYIYIYKCCKYRRLMKVMFIIVYPCLSIFKAPERPRPCTTCPAIISRCLACHRSFSTHWRSIDFPNRCQRSRRSRPCHWQWPRNPAPTSDPWRRTTRRTGSGSHDTRSGRD